MRLSNPAISLALWLFVAIVVSGCGSSTGNSNTATQELVRRLPSVPFPATEPEKYSTELITAGVDNERRYLIARDGLKQRIEFDVGTERHLVWIKNEKVFVVDPQKKIYAEKEMSEKEMVPADFISDLTQQLLTAKYDTDFEFVKNEGGLDIYRAVINGSDASETLIYIDKELKLPVKTEFYSIMGATRELRSTTRVNNFSLEADDSSFTVPSGFRKTAYSSVIR